MGAQAVLIKQQGYKDHPQLTRFYACISPLSQMTHYLHAIQQEATRRGYNYDRSLILPSSHEAQPIEATHGQIAYERKWLLSKLLRRDPTAYVALLSIPKPDLHPLFVARVGDIEAWERVKM